MASIDVQNAVDTMLLSAAADNNYQGYDGLWCGLYSTNLARVLLKFDWTGIPDTDQIDSASFTVTINSTDSQGGATTLSLHRVLVAWTISQATWNSRVTGTAWGTAGLQSGVDYEASALATANIGDEVKTGTVMFTLPSGAGVEKPDLDNGNGWFIIATETQQGGKDTIRNLYATDNATPGNRPRLQVSSSAPGSGGKPYYAYAQQ